MRVTMSGDRVRRLVRRRTGGWAGLALLAMLFAAGSTAVSAQDLGTPPEQPDVEKPRTADDPATETADEAEARVQEILASIPPAPEGYRRITGFGLAYVFNQPSPDVTLLQDLLTTPVELMFDGTGYAAPSGEGETITGPLSDVGGLEPPLFADSAIRAVVETLEAAIAERGLIGQVAPESLGLEDRVRAHPEEPTLLILLTQIEVGPFPVDSIDLTFQEDHPDHPPLEELMNVRVQLTATENGWIAARTDGETREITLAEIPSLELQEFYASALRGIVFALRDELIRRNLIGVYVAVDPQDIQSADFVDNRLIDDNSLTILLFTGIVREVRTLASGSRIPIAERENNPLHTRFIERSPFQAWDGESERQDLLRRDELENYLFRLNRLPGRRVDAALSQADEQGTGAVLDYLIAENKSFFAYAQISNTGTEQTDELRERFGIIWNQVTNNDDILNAEFITANFDETNAFVASYEAPIGKSPYLRWRGYGSWSEFTASDVGFANEEFSGDSWSVGGEIAWNVLQHRDFFLDIVGGARWLNTRVNNEVVRIEGEDDFFLPYAGIRFDRRTDTVTTEGSILFEWNMPDVAGTDQETLNELGRLFVDDDWVTLQWDFRHSFYLEPLLNREAWEDVTSRESSTLAHEVQLSFRGQYAFDNRLIPQAEQVVGGLYTVRGYDESIVAGDTVYIASAEYRFHIPKSRPYQQTPGELFGQPFRWVPQEPYGSADWDLVLKAFVDIGRAENSDRLIFERDETLVGAGVGAELSLYRNVNLRVDWGFALEDVLDGEVESGDNRLHFVATFLF